ncbi:MAG: peptidoglycan-binding protein [Candidatus Gracilibacteria bacterium]|nr:peptidoglycan-binding protein [Candidatus Gracilibacteria bacterium]
MKKIISYFIILIALYLHLSIINLNEVNAEENIIVPQENNLIIPESETISSENPNVLITDIQQENNINTSTETYFIVSAYYSPLPDQEHYLKGNYEDEIILNGKGIKGASGKGVFAGMFAGPKSYEFGTKIYLEGIGIGEISDRGGAIVSASGSDSRGYQYDRIDVWMGFGEEGLKRALAWGKRTVKGKILNDNTTQINIDLSKLPAPDSAVKKLVSKPHVDKKSNPKLAIFDKYIGPESDKNKIKELQNLFTEMGLYSSGNVDGKYESVKKTLINYQIKIGVIKKETDDGAGYFGPKTRNKMQANYIAFLEAKKIEEEKKKNEEYQLALVKEQVQSRVEKHIDSIGNPKPGDVGENVRTLQKTLKVLGYLKEKDSAIFGDKTKTSLINYQIDKGIVKTKTDDGAGYFGPKTKEVLKNDLALTLEKQVLKERKLLSFKK